MRPFDDRLRISTGDTEVGRRADDLRVLIRANIQMADKNEAAGAADASRGVKGEASRWCEEYLWSQGGLCDQTSQTHAGRTPAT